MQRLSRLGLLYKSRWMTTFLVAWTSRFKFSTMFIISFLVLGFLGTSKSAVAFDDMECMTDADCPQNKFCYLVTNLCAPCNANYCFRLNRANSDWRKCHKEASDCGECLEGYYEEILADGKPRDACILSQVSKKHADFQQSKTEEDNDIKYFPVYAVYICAILLGIIVVVIIAYTRRQRPVVHIRHQFFGETNARLPGQANLTFNHTSSNSGIPPPYSSSSSWPLLPGNAGENGRSCDQVKQLSESSSPSAPYLVEPCSSLPDTINGNVSYEKQHLLQARPYLKPNYEEELASGTESLDGSGSDQENLEESPRNFENPSFEDETTRPSDWTPISRAEDENANEVSSSNSLGETRPKRVSTEMESESDSERKRMKTYEETEEQPDEIDRPFRCFSQGQSENDESSD